MSEALPTIGIPPLLIFLTEGIEALLEYTNGSDALFLGLCSPPDKVEERDLSFRPSFPSSAVSGISTTRFLLSFLK